MQKKSSDETPRFAQDDFQRGMENIGPDDVYRSGANGEIDADEIINRNGYEPYTAFEILLIAIIAAHPNAHAPQDRLRSAVDALIGKQKSGRPQTDDYDVLLDVAWRYHECSFTGESNIELAPIIRQCILSRGGALQDLLKRSEDGENSLVKRLKRKFEIDKDILLARVTSEMNPDRMNIISALDKIAEDLEKLNVKVDRTKIRARLRSGQKAP